ncbi:type VI secretion system baseplate subunit TssE [Zavarzinia sp.]|uniref:type VI secretion system baseplate subunit TssE n=1 Tax=Zavarzinia sp. TaxID=2027920 RepID=UPI0035626762
MVAFRDAHATRDAGLPAGGRGGGGAIGEQALREAIGRDLEDLLNTVSLEATVDLADFPRVRDSILNFGLPDLARHTIDEARFSEIEGALGAALARYEPRLSAGSIEVRREEGEDQEEKRAALQVRFLVAAEMRAEPFAVPVEFIADMQRDTGRVAVDRDGKAGWTAP